MAAIVASLILIGIAIWFIVTRPDPNHEFMLSLYERVSDALDSQSRFDADPKLPRAA